MDIFDNEVEIIEHFQHIQSSSVMLFPENDEGCESVFQSIYQENKWKKWTNSSGKADPPPDFFSDELGLMMDVMRVDDHGYIGKNGKTIVNPTLARESVVMRELKEKGIFEAFPNAKLYLNVDTKLPTKEDHNYTFYRDSFIRTLENHKKKIDSYKANHLGLELIFFVFDEASAYFETAQPAKTRALGEIVQGSPHLWFFDEAFISSISNSQIDYLVWFTPYKHSQAFDQSGAPLLLPEGAVIKIKECKKMPTIKYNADRVESVEL